MDYEDYKRSYQDTERKCSEEGISFIPLICEADGGGWGPAAYQVWSEIAKHKSNLTGELRSVTATRLAQSLSVILHRENARAIIRRARPHILADYRDFLAASAARESNSNS